jgi:hypothetical protein
MKNLQSSFKKFLGNKNTVTILGVVLVIVILYIGYNYRINSKVSLTDVPVAKETIAPKTEITDSMIKTVSVPSSFLEGNYYSKAEKIVGKYTNYNATIAAGSLFYEELIVDAEDLPDSVFSDLPDGYRVASLTLSNLHGVYGGPGDYIDIYFSGINSDDKVMFGQFLNGIEILAIVDANGNNAYGTTSEDVGSAETMYLAVPEEVYLLLGRLDRLNEAVADLDYYLVLTPHLVDPDVDNVDIYLTSDDIKKLINDNSKEVDTKEEKITTDSTKK